MKSICVIFTLNSWQSGSKVMDIHDDGYHHLSQIPGFDASYDVIYYNSWSTYEESGWLAILHKGDSYFELSGGYSVMAEGPQDDTWDPNPITQEDALQEMIDMDETCAEVERDMS